MKKKIDENDVETVLVYNTDSIALDIDKGDGDVVRDLVRNIAKKTPIYSLGFEDPEGHILRDYKRQSDDGSCATYSLFDIETMLANDYFSNFVKKNHAVTSENNIFDITALPQVFMSTIQSINGKEVAGEVVRNGLRHFLESNSTLSKVESFEINGELTDLVIMFGKLKQEKIPNVVVDIMHSNNFALYTEAYGTYGESCKDMYNLNSENFSSQKEEIKNYIHKIANDQCDHAYDVSSENNSKTKSLLSLLSRLKKYDEQSGTSFYSQIKERVKASQTALDLLRSQKSEASKIICSKQEEESEKELLHSAFAKGSNTAKLIEQRRKNSNISNER